MLSYSEDQIKKFGNAPQDQRGQQAHCATSHIALPSPHYIQIGDKFEVMRRPGTFWKEAKRLVNLYETESALPCECAQ